MPAFDARLRRGVIACGVFSSILYVGTDILGGLRYPGYSFTSQAISELAAYGAPSKGVVDPLFIVCDVLALVFALGALRVSTDSRSLRVADQRGTAGAASDVPHILWTSATVLLFLIAIIVGAIAFGRRFRVYSFVTLGVVVVASALTAPYSVRLAANESTPGFGILERIDVYGIMLWLAVFAFLVLRRSNARDRSVAIAVARSGIGGSVAPGFEAVCRTFEKNFAERGEIGAVVAAYWHGEKVVDLWGGRRLPGGDEPWKEDTMVVVMSTTTGLASMTLAVANAQGWLDYDAPVSRYWPEFAQNGKGTVTVRQLLAHEAGLVLLDEPLTVEAMHDLDGVARLLARQNRRGPPARVTAITA